VSILDYREQGYLPETMLNFLSLIGWSLDDKTEIMSRRELIDYFSLDRIGRTGAVFNRDKLDWMNGAYIRSLDIDDLTARVLPFFEKGLPSAVKRPLDTGYVKQMVPLIQERIITLADAPVYAEFFFVDPAGYDASMLLGKKMDEEATLKALKAAEKRLYAADSFDPASLEDKFRRLADEIGLKAGQLFSVLRNATTGRTATPPLFDTMAVLGKETCLRRINRAINVLEDNPVLKRRKGGQ
jgi:glutamyl-tRNA synthetase